MCEEKMVTVFGLIVVLFALQLLRCLESHYTNKRIVGLEKEMKKLRIRERRDV